MAKKKKYKVYKKGGESFKPHMMYNTKTGESYLANTYDEHARMDAMGYGHEPMMRHGGMPCYECGGHVKYQDGGEGQAIYNPNTDTYSSRYSLPEFQVTANDPRIANAVRQGQSDFLRGAFESMSAPQKQMVEMFTGKQQFPSEAMGIENPYGAMAVDMILDPTILFGGLGAVGKMSKVPKGLKAMTKGVKKLDPYSRLDDLREEVRKEGLDWYRELAAEEAEKVAKFKRGVDQEITKATIGRQPVLNKLQNFPTEKQSIIDDLFSKYRNDQGAIFKQAEKLGITPDEVLKHAGGRLSLKVSDKYNYLGKLNPTNRGFWSDYNYADEFGVSGGKIPKDLQGARMQELSKKYQQALDWKKQGMKGADEALQKIQNKMAEGTIKNNPNSMLDYMDPETIRQGMIWESMGISPEEAYKGMDYFNNPNKFKGSQAFNELYPNKYGGTMKYEFGGSSTAPQNINTGDIGRTNIDLMKNHLAENTMKNILQQRDELVAQMTEQMYQYGGGFNYDERLKENPNRAFGAMAAQNYYDAQNKAMQSGKNFWNSIQDFAQNYQTPRPYQPPMEKVESKKADLSGLYTPTQPQLAIPQGGIKGAADYMMYGGEYAYGGDLPKAQYGPPGAFYNQAKAAEDQQARMAAAVGASQGNIPLPTPQEPYERVMPWTRPIRNIKNWWDRPLGQASPEEIRRQNLEVQRWAAEQRRKKAEAEAKATATGSGTAQAKQNLSAAEQEQIDAKFRQQLQAKEEAAKLAEKAKLTKTPTAANVAENEANKAGKEAGKEANEVIKGNTDEASEGPAGTDTKTDNTKTGTVRTVGDGYYGQPMGRFKLKGKVKEYDPLTGKMIKKTKIEPLKYDTAYGPQNVFGRRGPRVVKIPINQTYNINPFRMDLTPGSESFNALYNTSRSSDAVEEGLTPEQIAGIQAEADYAAMLGRGPEMEYVNLNQPGAFRRGSQDMTQDEINDAATYYKGMQELLPEDHPIYTEDYWPNMRKQARQSRKKGRQERRMDKFRDQVERELPLTDEELNQMQNQPLKYGGMPEYQMAGSTFNLNNYQPGQFTEGFGPQEGGFGPMEKGFNLWETGESPYMSRLKETELEGKWKQKGLGQGWSMLGPGLTFLGDALNARQVENPDWAYTAGANKPILMANDADRGSWTKNAGFFRPDQQTPVQFGKYGGQMYQNGGEYELTDQEIQAIISAGGEVEFL